jgi:hypothetical protein
MEVGSIDGVEIFIISPRFKGNRCAELPSIKVTNSGHLSHFNVGDSDGKWTYQNEENQVSFLYFNADCTG